MEKIKVGINGFGRIGSAIFRSNLEYKYFDVVAINDINDNVENLAYLLKYDSIHGILNDEVIARENEIQFNDAHIRVFSEPKMEEVPWNDLDIDLVIGCTGS